jgi:hypothetical protein
MNTPKKTNFFPKIILIDSGYYPPQMTLCQYVRGDTGGGGPHRGGVTPCQRGVPDTKVIPTPCYICQQLDVDNFIWLCQ